MDCRRQEEHLTINLVMERVRDQIHGGYRVLMKNKQELQLQDEALEFLDDVIYKQNLILHKSTDEQKRLESTT